jgi:prepilin-type N-terminal cleavage/methylation domain-containing protein
VKKLGNQKGLTLIEVIIASAVFAAIAVSVFIALVVSTRTTASVNENTTAESLTRAELEYIKSCAYDDINNPPDYGDPNSRIPPEHSSYSMTLTVETIADGLQKVTVKVYHDGELVVTTEGYKVNRRAAGL